MHFAVDTAIDVGQYTLLIKLMVDYKRVHELLGAVHYRIIAGLLLKYSNITDSIIAQLLIRLPRG